MNITKILAGGALLMASAGVAAMPSVAGKTVLDSSGDLYTFTFDEGFTKDIVSSDGLFFTNGSIPWSLQVEFGGGTSLRQDWPANGGLGVDGGKFGDNWEAGEILGVSLSGGLTFDLVSFTVNGGNGGAHGDCVVSNAWYEVSSSKGASNLAPFDTRDGCNDSDIDFSADIDPDFGDIMWVTFADSGLSDIMGKPITPWTGYLESLTIRVASSDVPAPSVIALFSLGLLAFGLARRRKA